MKKTLFLILMLVSLTGVLFGEYLLNEGFEGTTFPPAGWTLGPDTDGYNWERWTGGPSGAMAGSMSYDGNTDEALSPNNWLITPSINLGAVGSSTKTLMFDYVGQNSWQGANEKMSVYLSTTGNTTADFLHATNGHALWTHTLTATEVLSNGYVHHEIPLTGYTGNVYIAFRHWDCNDIYTLFLDNIKVFSPLANDLSITSLSANPSPLDLDITPAGSLITGIVSNIGATAATGYTVNLWKLGSTTPLQTWADGANIPAGSTRQVTYTYLPPVGVAVLYMTVDYASDMDTNNNTSANISFEVFHGSDTFVQPLNTYTGINPSTSTAVPAQFYMYYNYSQSIYKASEMGNTPRNINSITYSFINAAPFDTTLPSQPAANMPVRVYVGHTTLDAFTGTNAWIAGLTQVYNGTIGGLTLPANNPSGADLVIPFSSPFSYNGSQNLVVAFFSGNGSGYGRSQGAWFMVKSLTEGSGGISRTLFYSSDDAINPSSPVAGVLYNTVPVVKFGLASGATVELSGRVTTDGTTGIAGVTIARLDNPLISTTSNATGQYSIPVFNTDNVGIYASYPGYELFNSPILDTSTAVAVDATHWTYNFQMTTQTLVVVSGTLKAGWNGETQANVPITFHHPTGIDYPITTSGSGVFAISLPPSANYVMSIAETAVYQAYTANIPVGTVALPLGDVFLIERAFQPIALQAVDTQSGGKIVSWISPTTPTNTHTYIPSNAVSGGGVWINGSTPFSAFMRYSVTDVKAGLAGGNTRKIYRVAFMPSNVSGASTYTITILHSSTNMASPPANDFPTYSSFTLLAQQSIGLYQTVSNIWNYIDLEDLVDLTSITTGQIWVGISVTGNGSIATNRTTPSSYRGDIYYIPGSDAYGVLATSGFGSWMLAAYTVDVPTGGGAPMSAVNVNTSTGNIGSTTDILATIATEDFSFDPLRVVNSAPDITRAFTNYRLYRVPVSAYNNAPATWGTPIYSSNGVTFTDETPAMPNIPWVYALVSVYNQGVETYEATSLPIYSGIQSLSTSDVYVSVLDNTGNTLGLSNVTLVMTNATNQDNQITAYTYDNISESFKFSNVTYGIWNVYVSGPSFQPNNIIINVFSAQVNASISLLSGNLLWSQSFEDINSFPPNGWLNFDVDGDHYLWRVDGTGHVPQEGYQGMYSTFSQSYCSDTAEQICLWPDNWLITPVITLDPATDYTLSFAVKSYGREINEEHLTVYAIWSPLDNVSQLITMLDDNPDYGGQYSQWEYGELDEAYGERLNEHTTRTQNWVPIAIPLESLGDYSADQLANLRFAFRHWHSWDNNFLMLDDIRITATNISHVDVTGTIRGDDLVAPNNALDGARVEWVNSALSTDTGFAVTDAAGHFTIPQANVAGSYLLEISKTGYQTKNTEVTINTTNLPPITLNKLYAISGTVYLGVGNTSPLSGANLSFAPVGGGATITGVSGGNGAYSVNLIATEYNVTINYQSQGQAMEFTEALLVTGADNAVSFHVQALFSITGLISLQSAPLEPISAATVRFTNTNTSGYNPTTFTTTLTGRYTIVAAAGSYDITVSGELQRPGYTSPYVHTISAHSVSGDESFNIAIPATAGDGDNVAPPTITALKSNYPNPFNPTTTIAFDIAKDTHVSIDVYNIKGQKVKTLTSENYRIGRHSVIWNGDDANGRAVGSGVYFYRMTTDENSHVQKMLLMK